MGTCVVRVTHIFKDDQRHYAVSVPALSCLAKCLENNTLCQRAHSRPVEYESAICLRRA
jgi:hypothetical protein